MTLSKQVNWRMLLNGAAVLFVLAVPLALALSNFRWFVLEPGNYLRGQERHGVSASTGLPPAELAAIDRGMVRYFQSDRDSFPSSLEGEGVTRSPFSERDAAHMLDVHDLVRGVLTLHWLAGAFVLGFLVVALLVGARRLAARCILLGSSLTVATLGLLGVLSLLDWDALFLRFHFISFNNDLWRLDPRRDALVRLYPQGFFMDATIQMAAMTVVEAVVLAVLALIFLRRSPRGRRRVV